MPLSRAAFYRLLLFLTPICLLYVFVSRTDIRTSPLTKPIPSSPLPWEKVEKSKVETKIENPITIASTTKEKTTVLTTKVDTTPSDQPKEAFVTFSNNQPTYLALLKIFLDSVHTFSTRPVIAYGVDVDLDINTTQYPRVIKRRLAQSDCGPSVYFCKIHAIVSSGVDYGVLMETDDIVNYDIDVLFDVLRVWPYPVPISPRHPDDPGNYHHFLQQHNVPKPTTPYIHAHVIWNYRALPFLKNLQSLLKQGHFQGANYDETGVNVMLWAAKANHTLCKYDPYFTYMEPYEKWPEVINCSRYCHTVFLTLHGSKDVQASADVLQRLKKNAGKPTMQTLGTGGFKYWNDTSATCCYPDSKPSPIHPLLCEHPAPQ